MSGVSLDESSQLSQFLTRQDILEQVVQYALQVPTNPEDKDESYKFPNLAQELICNSSLLCQVLIEGGRAMPQDTGEEEDKQESQDIEDDNNTDEGGESNGGPESGAKSSVKSKTLENPTVVLKPSDVAKEANEDTDQPDKAEENEDDANAKEEVIKLPEAEKTEVKDEAEEDVDTRETIEPEAKAEKELEDQKNTGTESPTRVKEEDEQTQDVTDKKAESGEADAEAKEKKDEDGAEDKKEEGSSDEVVNISDVFLNMEMKQPAYIKEDSEGDASKESTKQDTPIPTKGKAEQLKEEADVKDKETLENKDEDDDDDDFERDEESTDPVVKAVSNILEEADNASKKKAFDETGNIDEDDADEKPKSRNNLPVKVNVNMTKSTPKNEEKPTRPQPLMQNYLLDLVFSFIGVSSKPDSELIRLN